MLAGDRVTLTLLLTRPEPGASAFAQLCATRFSGMRILSAPVMQISPIGAPIDVEGPVILSSQNAVAQVALGHGQFAAYCVGAKTAALAREKGLNVVLVAPDADALVAGILRDPPGGELLHLRGAHTRGDICARLIAAEQACVERIVYDQIPIELSQEARLALKEHAPVILPLFSPRSAKLLALQLGEPNAPLLVAAFSRAVQNAWAGPKEVIELAAEPTSQEMLNTIERLIDQSHSLEGNTMPS